MSVNRNLAPSEMRVYVKLWTYMFTAGVLNGYRLQVLQQLLHRDNTHIVGATSAGLTSRQNSFCVKNGSIG